ncbi:hypothetical protein TNCV_4318351 [Trichonephila clavipes]|nr:hypothetical protein TNCV_4318351 [Trichonephila clavipes]
MDEIFLPPLLGGDIGTTIMHVHTEPLLLKALLESKVALQEYHRLKDLRKGPISSIGLRKMIMKFEETGDLGVLPGRRRKPVETETIKEIATSVGEKASSFICSSGSGQSVSPPDHRPPRLSCEPRVVGPYSATVLVALSSAPDHQPPRLESAR